MSLKDNLQKKVIEGLKRNDKIHFFHLIENDIELGSDFVSFNRKDSEYGIKPNEFDKIVKLWFEGYLFLWSAFNKPISIVEELFAMQTKYHFHIISKIGEQDKLNIDVKESHIYITFEVKKKISLNYSKNLSDFEFDNTTNKIIHQNEPLTLDSFLNKISNLAASNSNITVLTEIDKLSNTSFIPEDLLKHLLVFSFPTERNKKKQISFYIYPGYEKNGEQKTSAGVVIYNIDNNEKDFIKIHSDDEYNIAYWSTADTLDYLIKVLQISSIKSAIAAIMSRNGSHNIGSHVLSAISYNFNNPVDMQIFSQYLQQRMDFIAQITTDIPLWTSPMHFVSQLMRNFYMQRILLQHIVESEGLTIKEYNNNNESNKNKLEIILLDDNNNIIVPGDDNNSVSFDPMIAIPGGVTGTHAFYTILENYIRNSAKHSYNKDNDNGEGLKLYIKIKDNDDNLRVTIFDNVSKDKEEKIKTKLEKALYHSFINNNGSVIYKNWGIAEMKIGAGYLNQKPIDIIGSEDEKSIKSFISISHIKNEFTNNNNHICYQLNIPKPKKLLIVGKGDKPLKNGIEWKENITENDTLDYEFVLFTKDDKEINEYKLPVRTFVIRDNDETSNVNNNKTSNYIFLSKTEKIIQKILKAENDDNTIKELLEFLYKKWIEELLNKTDKKCVNLLVSPFQNTRGGGSNINQTILYKIIIKSLLMKNKKNKLQPPVPNNHIQKLNILLNKDDDTLNQNNTDSLNIIDIDDFYFLNDENYNNILEQIEILTFIYNKYIEDIETLPKNLVFHKSENNTQKNEYKKTFNFADNPENCFEIKYQRHSNGGETYSEALSGSQTGFNAMAEFVKDNESDKFLPYRLIETGLLGITLIDERVKKYIDSSNENVKKRFKGLNMKFYDSLDNKTKKEILEDKQNNILIIHQGILDKNNIGSEDELWEKLAKTFQHIFITSGRGKPEKEKMPTNVKVRFLPFSNIRVSMMQQYPEKNLLVQNLLKIV